MIKKGFIKKQAFKSRSQGETTLFLRQYVFRVVDEALRAHYGANYSTRCLQSSIAIKDILEDLGIKVRLFKGAMCLANATKDTPPEFSWAGFWGEDHHVWAVTEFFELVDLTVSQLHLHPASTRDNSEPIPAIWWSPADVWPPVIRYLPDFVGEVRLEGENEEDLKRFLSCLRRCNASIVSLHDVDSCVFEPILHGPLHINELVEAGHPWVLKCIQIQDLNVPMPDWVLGRERLLMTKYMDGEAP